MTNTKHTTGPWGFVRADDGYDVKAPHGVLVAYCGGNHIDEANARLIAAAPELLGALQNQMNGIDTGAIMSDHDETFANAGSHRYGQSSWRQCGVGGMTTYQPIRVGDKFRVGETVFE